MAQMPRSRSGSFRLAAPLAAVMPMFTAEGERSWAPGWEPQILSGGEERGSAFRTLNDRGEASTWIVTCFDAVHGRASYARLAEGSNIGLVDVRCAEDEGGGTRVTVTYTLTALHAGAVRFVEEFVEPSRYARMMEEWARAIAGALGNVVAYSRAGS